jgi:hypothetical protein
MKMKSILLEIENDEFADLLVQMLEKMQFVKVNPLPNGNNQSSIRSLTVDRKLFYGIFKDKIHIAPDFDAPLDDFKEYME